MSKAMSDTPSTATQAAVAFPECIDFENCASRRIHG